MPAISTLVSQFVENPKQGGARTHACRVATRGDAVCRDESRHGTLKRAPRLLHSSSANRVGTNGVSVVLATLEPDRMPIHTRMESTNTTATKIRNTPVTA